MAIEPPVNHNIYPFEVASFILIPSLEAMESGNNHFYFIIIILRTVFRIIG
jgi:hypothetical protein